MIAMRRIRCGSAMAGDTCEGQPIVLYSFTTGRPQESL